MRLPTLYWHLARNRFRISPSRWGLVVTLTMAAFFNSITAWVQRLLYGKKIDETELVDDPIFILGHWRSGTTLLHELLSLDDRHVYPSTYQCFAPNHFLVSASLVKWWAKFLLPKQRPMDNMAVAWERPQEDEFALCNMGVPSTYMAIAFPRDPKQFREYLDLQQVQPEELQNWKQKLLWLFKCITLQNPKRIVVKSPQHTCRIKALLEMFPNAKFVHIARDPQSIYPSTVRLWNCLSADHGLQVVKDNDISEQVFDTFRHMYEVFEQTEGLIPEGNLCEVRFEELVANPVEQIHNVYDQLGLGGFEEALPALQKHVEGMAGYQKNRFELDPETSKQIKERWDWYIQRYGYTDQ